MTDVPALDYGLRGKVALVTGAASGIGQAAAGLFAAIAWLVSPPASFVTGEALAVEGGLLGR